MARQGQKPPCFFALFKIFICRAFGTQKWALTDGKRTFLCAEGPKNKNSKSEKQGGFRPFLAIAKNGNEKSQKN